MLFAIVCHLPHAHRHPHTHTHTRIYTHSRYLGGHRAAAWNRWPFSRFASSAVVYPFQWRVTGGKQEMCNNQHDLQIWRILLLYNSKSGSLWNLLISKVHITYNTFLVIYTLAEGLITLSRTLQRTLGDIFDILKSCRYALNQYQQRIRLSVRLSVRSNANLIKLGTHASYCCVL